MKILLYKLEGFIFGLLIAIAVAGVGIGVIEDMKYKELLRSTHKSKPNYDSSYRTNYKYSYASTDDKYN